MLKTIELSLKSLKISGLGREFSPTWKYNHLISFLPYQEQRADKDFESQMSQNVFSTQNPRERRELQGTIPQDSEVCVVFCLSVLSFCSYNTSHPIMGV